MAAMYAAYGLVSGVHVAYLPVWLEARGLSSAAIGIVLAVPLFARVLMTPLTGVLADRLPDRRVAVQGLLVAASASFLLLLPLDGPLALLVLVPLVITLYQGSVPVGDAIALALDRRGEIRYGAARLWASAAYIAANLAGGVFVGALGAPIVFPMMAAALALYTLSSFCLPRSGPLPGAPVAAAETTVTRREYLAFLATAAILQASHGMLYGFGTLHWLALGYSEPEVGLLWGTGTLAEIGVFALAATTLRNTGPRRLMLVAISATILRWLLMPLDFGLGYQLLLQCFHAATFGAAHLATMRFISTRIDERRAATAQSTYALMVGLSMGLATLASGPLVASVGGLAFLASAALASLALPMLLVVGRQPQSARSGGLTREPS